MAALDERLGSYRGYARGLPAPLSRINAVVSAPPARLQQAIRPTETGSRPGSGDGNAVLAAVNDQPRDVQCADLVQPVEIAHRAQQRL